MGKYGITFEKAKVEAILDSSYTVVNDEERKGKQKVQCNYCRKYEIIRRISGMINHLLECPDVDIVIKAELETICGNELHINLLIVKIIHFFSELPPKQEAPSKPKKPRPDCPKYLSTVGIDDDTSDDDFDDNDDDDSVAVDENTRVVKILTKLLDTSKADSASEAASGSKRKLSQMTDLELEREIKEQKVQLIRLQCDQARKITRMASALISSLDRIAKSSEIVAKGFKQNRALGEPICVFPDIGGDDRSTITRSEFQAFSSN